MYLILGDGSPLSKYYVGFGKIFLSPIVRSSQSDLFLKDFLPKNKSDFDLFFEDFSGVLISEFLNEFELLDPCLLIQGEPSKPKIFTF